MIKIVSDPSPLIFLAKIEGLNLLSDYKIYVPRQVEDEVLKGSDKHRKDSLQISKFLKSSNVIVVETTY